MGSLFFSFFFFYLYTISSLFVFPVLLLGNCVLESESSFSPLKQPALNTHAPMSALQVVFTRHQCRDTQMYTHSHTHNTDTHTHTCPALTCTPSYIFFFTRQSLSSFPSFFHKTFWLSGLKGCVADVKSFNVFIEDIRLRGQALSDCS